MSKTKAIMEKYGEYADDPSVRPFSGVLADLDNQILKKRQEWIKDMVDHFRKNVSDSWIRRDRKEGEELISYKAWSKDINGFCGFTYGLTSEAPISAFFVSLEGTPIKTVDTMNPDTFGMDHTDCVEVNITQCRVGEDVMGSHCYVIPFEHFEMTREEYDAKFGYFDVFEFAMDLVR